MSDKGTYHSFRASGNNVFEIQSRYTFIKTVGQGAYGVVIAAKDSSGPTDVAIKKIGNAFADLVDAKRILREIKLMKQFTHENIVRITDLMPPPPQAEVFDDIYIVQDLMDTDLHRIIYSKQVLSMDHIEYFVYQILRGLKYLHSANVLHRDLKPSNLLVNANCDLKICDFGLAKLTDDNSDHTEYVVTRWYRAPEIMLACQDYTKSIDIWSVGCIFAEMLARKPFFPGTDYLAQLRLICQKLGRPSHQELDFVTSEKARAFMLDLPEEEVPLLSELFPEHSTQHHALELLSNLLIIRPDRRISVEAALAHPFMEALHSEDDEPTANTSISFDFENEELTKERLQELVWNEIRDFHTDLPTAFPSSRAQAKAESKWAMTDEKYPDSTILSRKRSISPSSK